MNFFNQSLSFQQEDVEQTFNLRPVLTTFSCPGTIPHEQFYQQQDQNPFLIHEISQIWSSESEVRISVFGPEYHT